MSTKRNLVKYILHGLFLICFFLMFYVLLFFYFPEQWFYYSVVDRLHPAFVSEADWDNIYMSVLCVLALIIDGLTVIVSQWLLKKIKSSN